MKMRCVYLSCVIALVLTVGASGQTLMAPVSDGFRSGGIRRCLFVEGIEGFWTVTWQAGARAGLRDDKDPKTEEEAKKAAREQRALKLLDEVIADSRMLKLPENRIHILGAASSMVWPRDEKRARELLKVAADTLAEIIASLETSDAEPSTRASQLFQAKSELFQAAVNYDPAAALDFLHKTPIPGLADQEAQLELSAVWQLAAKDPQSALKLAEEGLVKGVMANYSGIVSQLRAKDPAMAAQLAADIFQKVQATDLGSDNQSWWMAVSLIQVALQASQSRDQSKTGSEAAVLSASDLKSLISKVVATSISLAKGNPYFSGEWQMARNALTQIQSMLPQIEKVDSQLSARIGGQISTALQSTPATSNPQLLLQNLIQNGTAEDLIAGAENAPASLREQYYQQAAWKALNQNDVDKASQIVNEHYTNPLARQQMLDQIEQRLIWKASGDGKLDEAQSRIARLRSKEHRVQALVNLAGELIGKGDKKKALELLDEARALLPDTPENYFQVSLLLNIARGYSKIEPSRGVQILNGIATLLARLIPAAETLEGFDIQATFRNGEILMQPGSQLGSTIVQFAEQVGILATGDYAAAVMAADSAGRPELRIMADLSIASNLLNQAGETGESRVMVGRGNGLARWRE